MELETTMAIISTGLSTLLLVFFTSWFKEGGKIYVRFNELKKLIQTEKSLSQAKEDGRLEARKENKELIAEVERSLADTRNSSEFSYWKRKDDSEKLEQFFDLIYEGTFDLEKMIVNTIDSIIELIEFIKQSDETDLMTIYKIADIKCSRELISPRALLYCPVFYNLYFLQYNDSHTKQSLTAWSEKSNYFIASNTKIASMSAQFTKQASKESAIRFLDKLCTDIGEHGMKEMDAIYTARNNVFNALTSLSEAVYSD